MRLRSVSWSALDLHHPQNHRVRVRLSLHPANPHLHSHPLHLVVVLAPVTRPSHLPAAHRVPAHRVPVHTVPHPFRFQAQARLCLTPAPAHVPALPHRAHLASHPAHFPHALPVSHLHLHVLALPQAVLVLLRSVAHPHLTPAPVARPVTLYFRRVLLQAAHLLSARRLLAHLAAQAALRALAHRRFLRVVLPVTLHFLRALRPLALRPLAVHLLAAPAHRAQVSMSYRVYISIPLVMNLALL